MKSILVIDTPQDCLACPCIKLFSDFEYCSVNMTPLGLHIPKWCPLRPMPEKMIPEMVLGNKFAEGCVQGWNDCLEEILGEDNG